ncbi:hypothetical protein Y032_0042g539 [Ancylostoma ceylanicum]|uniref:MADF domain-containing protein n=1 Tax=Ancylostoma ceylanicum TaxID=53326 RepID=A0A016UF60_9BILA|nr:hypothetical protein Y032_0042g539 [Ancylostoma ceylanicum]
MNVVGQGPYITDKGKMILIDLVREQEAIWNPNCPTYSKPDLKCAAWNHVQAEMKKYGFEYTLNFLRKQWNNLLVYWKKNLRYNKKTPGREWPFGRSMNFLATRYGSTYPHCGRNSDISTRESQDDSDNNADFDSLDDDPQPGRSVDPEDDASNLLSTEVELESFNEEADARLRLVHGDVTPPPIQGVERRVSREVSFEQYKPKRPCSRNTREDVSARTNEGEDEKEANGDVAVTSSEAQREPDKFDRYAAFLASTLRDMPEAEAKQKMKSITLLLLDDNML